MKKYFTLDDAVKEQFYKLPKVFFLKDSVYYSMTLTSKSLYSILSDRNSISIKNKWIDEENKVYFIYKQEDLCDITGIKDPKTLRKYLKELETYELIERKKQGFNLPDRFYLIHPNVTEEQFYRIYKASEGELEPENKCNSNDGEKFPNDREKSPNSQGKIPGCDKEKTPPSNNNMSNLNNINNNKKEKEKKKTKKIPTQTEIDEVINAYTSNEELKTAIIEFVKFRKGMGKGRFMTTYAVKLLTKKLDRFANDDNTKIEIINKSILNGWSDVYELKEPCKNKGGFNNESRSNTSKNNEPSKGESKEEHDAKYWEEQNRILNEMLDF